MNRLRIILLGIILVLSVFIISSCGQNNKPLTIIELAAKYDAEVGVLNKTYQINSNYTYPDGSYIFVDFKSIKKHKEVTDNEEKKLNNVIVIALDNGLPIQENSEFASKVRYLGAFLRILDNTGKGINIKNIYAQTGNEFYEVIIELPEEKDGAFLLIGGFDQSSVGKSKLIFTLD